MEQIDDGDRRYSQEYNFGAFDETFETNDPKKEVNILRKRKFVSFLILTFSIGGILVGCQREKAEKIDLSKNREEVEMVTRKDAIRIAIGAMVSPDRTFNYYKQLLDYLSKKLEKPIILLQRRTYSEVNDLLGKGEVEFGFICSGPYVEARRDFGVEILVVPVVGGETYYHSYIIVHKDSDINNFEDLKGKTFAFMDPMSLTGTVFPTYLLLSKGYTPQDYFSNTVVTYSHDNSIIAVAEKLVDGAAAHSLIWNYLSATDPEYTSETKIIHKSPPFGIPPVVVPKDLDPQFKEKLKKIFLNLHKDEEAQEILKNIMIDKFTAGDDAAYEEVRRIKKLVENTR